MAQGFWLVFPCIAEDDFLGVQNYFRKIVDQDGAKEPSDNVPLIEDYNIELQAGYAKTFCLTGVDRETQERYPKDSLWVLSELFRKSEENE